MKIVRFFSAVLAVVAMAVSANSASANLFSNASFESVLEYGDPSLPNWFAFFGAGSTGTFSTIDGGYSGTIMPSDGSHHLSIANDGTPDGFSGVFQRVAVAAGNDYTFSFDAKSNSGASFPLGAEYRIEWFDAGLGGLGATPNVPIMGALTDSYQNFDITATAPAGAAIAQAVIAVETFSASGTPGNLFVDNASFVPEPSSMVLGGMGLLAIIGGRRRK